MHALGFRVMRLCKPSLQDEGPRKLDLDADLTADWSPSSPSQSYRDLREYPFGHRVTASNTSDAFAFDGLLQLPQSFGVIYLGEVRILRARDGRSVALSSDDGA